VLRLTERTFLAERGAGEKTWGEIVCLQNRIRALYFSGAENCSDSALSVPNTLDVETPLSALPLSVRAEAILGRLGVQTLGQLLLTSEQEVLAQKNSGKKTIIDIRQNIRDYLDFIYNPPAIDVGRSFDDLMRGLCLDAKQSRYEWVVIARICRGETLESIGQKLGRTRERVRQIVVIASASIQRHYKASRTLGFVKDKITEILLENNGALSLEALEYSLAHRFGWLEESDAATGLKRAFDFFPILGARVFVGDIVQLRCESGDASACHEKLTADFSNGWKNHGLAASES
jgi:hypothetical protein